MTLPSAHVFLINHPYSHLLGSMTRLDNPLVLRQRRVRERSLGPSGINTHGALEGSAQADIRAKTIFVDMAHAADISASVVRRGGRRNFVLRGRRGRRGVDRYRVAAESRWRCMSVWVGRKKAMDKKRTSQNGGDESESDGKAVTHDSCSNGRRLGVVNEQYAVRGGCDCDRGCKEREKSEQAVNGVDQLRDSNYTQTERDLTRRRV